MIHFFQFKMSIANYKTNFILIVSILNFNSSLWLSSRNTTTPWTSTTNSSSPGSSSTPRAASANNVNSKLVMIQNFIFTWHPKHLKWVIEAGFIKFIGVSSQLKQIGCKCIVLYYFYWHSGPIISNFINANFSWKFKTKIKCF